MKKPLLLASIAGSALFLVAALVIIVGFVHQAGEKPSATASATTACAKYSKGSTLELDCEQGWQVLAVDVPNATDDSQYNGALKGACQNSEQFPAQSGATTAQQMAACTYGASQEFSSVNAAPASKAAGSGSAAKPATSSSSSKSSSSKSSSSKSSTSSSSKGSAAAKPAAGSTTTAATTAADSSSDSAATPAIQSDTPGAPTANDCQNHGGANVSGVWAGIPGVSSIIKGGCIGGDGVNPIYAFLSLIVTFATGVLGLVMVLMIVIAGLQYVISNGSPDIVRDAKNRINHVVTGFVIFVLMWGILQVLLPANVSVFK